MLDPTLETIYIEYVMPLCKFTMVYTFMNAIKVCTTGSPTVGVAVTVYVFTLSPVEILNVISIVVSVLPVGNKSMERKMELLGIEYEFTSVVILMTFAILIILMSCIIICEFNKFKDDSPFNIAGTYVVATAFGFGDNRSELQYPLLVLPLTSIMSLILIVLFCTYSGIKFSNLTVKG